MNTEIKQYFDILSNEDFPNFILPYLKTKSLKRLKGVGMFCGMDYCNMDIYNMKYYFSRLDHSIACACMAWNFTKDKTNTVLALLHDIGTPVFSHCVDYMLGDSKNQESSELNIYDVALNDKELLKLLDNDNINMEELNNIDKHTVIENKKPKLCTDRLEGIFSSVLVWLKTNSLEDIKKVYNDITITTNETNEPEMCFSTEKCAKKIFEMSLQLGYNTNINEDKFAMKYIGDMLKYMINKDYIKFEDLFTFTENDIINIIEKSEDLSLKTIWNTFCNFDYINRSNTNKDGYYCVSIETKKRYVDPLVKGISGVYRLTNKSIEDNLKLNKFLSYEDIKYSYIYLNNDIFNVNQKNLKKNNL